LGAHPLFAHKKTGRKPGEEIIEHCAHHVNARKNRPKIARDSSRKIAGAYFASRREKSAQQKLDGQP
jgi:hypothetical protein